MPVPLLQQCGGLISPGGCRGPTCAGGCSMDQCQMPPILRACGLCGGFRFLLWSLGSTFEGLARICGAVQDKQWPNTVCAPGTKCYRGNPYYWCVEAAVRRIYCCSPDPWHSEVPVMLLLTCECQTGKYRRSFLGVLYVLAGSVQLGQSTPAPLQWVQVSPCQ